MSYEEGHFIGKGTIHPEDIIISFIKILNRDAHNFIKQILQVFILFVLFHKTILWEQR